MTITTSEIYTMGRALSFSLLAPLQFFYGLWIGSFPTPYLFLVLLLSGYTFAVLSSGSAHNVVPTPVDKYTCAITVFCITRTTCFS